VLNMRTGQAYLLMLCILPAVGYGTDVLADPVERIPIYRAFLPGSNIPKWQNGLLITWKDDRVPATVLAFDRTGQVVTEASITFPDAVRITLYGPAVSATGRLAVGGSAFRADGAGMSFIAWIGRMGAVERVVQTSQFGSFELCFGSGETLWAVGRVRNPDSSEAQQYGVLRHYSRDGTLLGSLLPRESFARYNGQHPGAGSFLVAGSDRIGFYAPNAKEWIEIGASGTVLRRWKSLDLGSDLKDLRVTGATFWALAALVLRLSSGTIAAISSSTKWQIWYSCGHSQPGANPFKASRACFIAAGSGSPDPFT
jgi:hypothetical protein